MAAEVASQGRLAGGDCVHLHKNLKLIFHRSVAFHKTVPNLCQCKTQLKTAPRSLYPLLGRPYVSCFDQWFRTRISMPCHASRMPCQRKQSTEQFYRSVVVCMPARWQHKESFRVTQQNERSKVSDITDCEDS